MHLYYEKKIKIIIFIELIKLKKYLKIKIALLLSNLKKYYKLYSFFCLILTLYF